jgi:hypothetical protein
MPPTNAENARKLAKLSSDCSFRLTHLIRQNDGRTDLESRKILKSILGLRPTGSLPLLKASKVGWYGSLSPYIYNPVSGSLDGKSNCKAVCFTESTLAGLKAHRDILSVKYGISFDRDWLFSQGANPCLNIRSSLFKTEIQRTGERHPKHLYNFIPSQLHPYINIITESFDATHEREWRHAGDLNFSRSDALFVFCPQKDFRKFSEAQTHGKPVLFDLEWLDRV